jgi:CheY-like chemotaxis protein
MAFGHGELRGLLPTPVVHELKTSLSMIVGFAELLQTREDPETRAEAARGVVIAAARLQTTIESLCGATLESLDDRGANGRRRLMVFDDHVSDLELLRTAFPEAAFDLREVHDHEEGLDALEEVEPDLVILDWKLPRVGAETLAELKLRNPDLPVIVLAERDPKQRQIATLLDADGFITRPIDAVELLRSANLHATRPTG